jgi:hypothetical protein
LCIGEVVAVSQQLTHIDFVEVVLGIGDGRQGLELGFENEGFGDEGVVACAGLEVQRQLMGKVVQGVLLCHV